MKLKVNSYMDQRLDEKASTVAAIGYIKELSKLYKSDNWTLLSFITSPNYVSNILKKPIPINGKKPLNLLIKNIYLISS